jgi:hypothetical protein
VVWAQLFLQLHPSLIMPSNKGCPIMSMGMLASLSLSPPLSHSLSLSYLLGCCMHVHRQLMQTQPFKLGWSRARFINQATSSYSLSLSLCVCLSLSVSRTWFKRRERIAIHLFIPFHHHVLAIHMLLADLSLKTYYNCSTCWHKYDTLWL